MKVTIASQCRSLTNESYHRTRSFQPHIAHISIGSAAFYQAVVGVKTCMPIESALSPDWKTNVTRKFLSLDKSCIRYRKIPKISPGAYIFQRPILRGLFLERLIFGEAYLWTQICLSKSIGLAL